MSTSVTTIFKFSKKAPIQQWQIVNDGVMGGLSRGYLVLNKQGKGRFWGEVSLANNGGFTSIRHRFDPLAVQADQTLKLKLKGDGKRYQIRIKANSSDYYSYIVYVTTTGAWQEVSLPLEDFYPTFRGRRLDLGNFDQSQLEEIGVLIANKRAESFELLLDEIAIE